MNVIDIHDKLLNERTTVITTNSPNVWIRCFWKQVTGVPFLRMITSRIWRVSSEQTRLTCYAGTSTIDFRKSVIESLETQSMDEISWPSTWWECLLPKVRTNGWYDTNKWYSKLLSLHPITSLQTNHHV